MFYYITVCSISSMFESSVVTLRDKNAISKNEDDDDEDENERQEADK